MIAGDQNSDPLDGDSIPGSIQQLLDHPLVNTKTAPSSLGGPWATRVQDRLNDSHRGDPALDTADFCDFAPCGPGNLRVDYVLPRKYDADRRRAASSGRATTRPTTTRSAPFAYLVDLTGAGFPAPTTDHRAVWVDVTVPGA